MGVSMVWVELITTSKLFCPSYSTSKASNANEPCVHAEENANKKKNCLTSILSITKQVLLSVEDKLKVAR